MSASPLDQTLIAKKATAVKRLRNEPTILPTTPKWALDETALLVPFAGPNTAIGDSTHAPMNTPSVVASSACKKDNPNMIGKAPSTAVASELEPPQAMRTKSAIEALRSWSGIDSTPWRSISPGCGAARSSIGFNSDAGMVLPKSAPVVVTTPVPWRLLRRRPRQESYVVNAARVT